MKLQITKKKFVIISITLLLLISFVLYLFIMNKYPKDKELNSWLKENNITKEEFTKQKEAEGEIGKLVDEVTLKILDKYPSLDDELPFYSDYFDVDYAYDEKREDLIFYITVHNSDDQNLDNYKKALVWLKKYGVEDLNQARIVWYKE